MIYKKKAEKDDDGKFFIFKTGAKYILRDNIKASCKCQQIILNLINLIDPKMQKNSYIIF